jgi:hypothetical protein
MTPQSNRAASMAAGLGLSERTLKAALKRDKIAIYLSTLQKELARRRKENKSNRERRIWNMDAILKVELIKLIDWIEDELASVSARGFILPREVVEEWLSDVPGCTHNEAINDNRLNLDQFYGTGEENRKRIEDHRRRVEGIISEADSAGSRDRGSADAGHEHAQKAARTVSEIYANPEERAKLLELFR